MDSDGEMRKNNSHEIVDDQNKLRKKLQELGVHFSATLAELVLLFPDHKQFEISDMPANDRDPDSGYSRMNPHRSLTITLGQDGTVQIKFEAKNLVPQANRIAEDLRAKLLMEIDKKQAPIRLVQVS